MATDSLTEGMFPWGYAAGARIHSMSWGWSTPDYMSYSQDVDKYMHQNKDFLVLIAAGNDASCSEDYFTVGAPATAKNCIAVGASVNSKNHWAKTPSYPEYKRFGPAWYNISSVASFSSIGPTKDLRLKPDVVVPGHQIVSSAHQSENSMCGSVSYQPGDRNGLIAFSGTSMSTPILAGHVAMVRQYLMEGFYPTGNRFESDSFNPSGSLLKALIIAGAVNLDGYKTSISIYSYVLGDFCPTPRGTKVPLEKRPSFQQGYGRVQLNEILYFNDVTGSRFLHIASLRNNPAAQYDTAIAKKQTIVYNFCAYPDANENEIRIVLTWTDPPSSLAASKNLVNDLDLTVNYDGQSILGNSQSGMFEALQLTRDNLNNVEAVYLLPVHVTEGKKDIEVRVRGTAIARPPQYFSLVATGNLASGVCSASTSAGPPVRPLTKPPTKNPTNKPTTKSPTKNPTMKPTLNPTSKPTLLPAMKPTSKPIV
jgi:hypothetical protein